MSNWNSTRITRAKEVQITSYETSRTALVLSSGVGELTLPKLFSDGEGECTLLEYVLDSVWTVVDDIYVVFNREPSLRLVEAIAPFGVKIVIDKASSSLVSNMAKGLRATRSEHCFVVPENLPFIKPNVAFALFEAVRGYDAAVPKWSDGRVEPLVAVYRKKSLLRVVQEGSVTEPLSILDNLYGVRFVGIEDELKMLDPDLNSFFTVSGKEDVDRAKSLALVGRRKGR